MATHRTYVVVPDGSPSKDAVTVAAGVLGTQDLDTTVPAGGIAIVVDEAYTKLRGSELHTTLRNIAGMLIEDR